MKNDPEQKQKVYCYVDETGQDTAGLLFLVAVVIVGEHRDELRRALAQVEEKSGKRDRKWSRSNQRQRESYIRHVLHDPKFAGALYYSKYPASRAYVDLTILSTAKAINTHAPHAHSATILVDGLQRTEQHRFGAGLRRLRVSVRKVRGLSDQSDGFIRLADALAGFVRDSLSGNQRLHALYAHAMQDKVIREV